MESFAIHEKRLENIRGTQSRLISPLVYLYKSKASHTSWRSMPLATYQDTKMQSETKNYP